MAKNVFRGGEYIIHPDVKPQSSSSSPAPQNWKTGTTVTTETREKLIDAYFLGKKKRYFAISKTELEDLVALSPTKCAMIRVENIAHPDKFKMYWLPEREQDLTVSTDFYFIIENEFLYGSNPDDVPNGITFADGTDIYCATLGKKGKKYFVLINNMTFLDDGGGSGEPPGVGTKIPPGL